MIVAFTGPSKLTREQELAVVWRMEHPMPDDLDTWRSGCAYGVDTIAARQAVMTGILGVELFVPAAPHNSKLVAELSGRASNIIYCPSGDEPYRSRNEMMVDGADKLVAFVKSDKFYRSGEWMTINIAKGHDIPVDIVKL